MFILNILIFTKEHAYDYVIMSELCCCLCQHRLTVSNALVSIGKS